MKTPEGKIVDQIQTRLKKLKAEGHHLFWFKVHGSVYTKVGIPDLIVCWGGRFIAFEVKTPGKKPTKIQEHTMREINLAYGAAYTVTSAQQVEEILRHHPENDFVWPIDGFRP